MNFVLLDDTEKWKSFLPLTFTKPLSEIRIGILTIKEKWEKVLGSKFSYVTEAYLQKKFPFVEQEQTTFVFSHICPDAALSKAVEGLKQGEMLCVNDTPVAFCSTYNNIHNTGSFKRIPYPQPVFELTHIWDIFQKNEKALTYDFELMTSGRISRPLSKSVTVIGDSRLIFLEEGAKAEACIINTSTGPVYLGKNSEIMEGAIVRGALALCEHSVLKMGAKIYGATTIGPYSKVGGEVSNSVILGYSNKAHDGFLGNSVIGEWCNLGADTNNSNLKNNYGEVKLFNYAENRQINTGLQFCGLIMGDHSKAGINTMFNTGTVAGLACNIYGGGFPSTVIPDFSWGGSHGFEEYRLEKLFETAEQVFRRRGLTFTKEDKEILTHVYNTKR